jgi:hypothetical protein
MYLFVVVRYLNLKKIILKFRGSKDCYNRKVGSYTVNGMRNGSVYDSSGVVFGRYRRIITDGGSNGDWQEVEFTVELED